MNRIVLFCTTLFLSIGLYAQSGPNCRPINASLDADGYTYFELQEFVTNAVAGPGCEVTITNSFGGIVFGPEQLNPGDAVVFNACAYLSQTLKINVSNPSGACWSYLTFKQSNGPVLMGRSKDVYCFDSLILGGHIDDEPPLAFVPCVQEFDAAFVADWVQVYECGAPGDPVNDTVKVIYREYEAYDKHGNRGFTFDTITVFRLPYIDVVEVPNAYCAEKDTTYCGEGNPGPYMVYPERCIPANFGMDQDGDGSPCDTIYFLLYDDSLGRYVLNPFLNDTKCGLLTHLDYWSFGNNGCEENSKYVLEIKQTCVPPFDFTCGIDASLIPSNALREIAPGYFECEFWVVDLDTVAPIALCKAKADPSLAIISTSTHECAAHTYLPDVWVTDDWSGVKQVKATIEGIGSFIFTQNEDGSFSSHTQVKLPKNDDGYAIIYEAYDSCHNIGTDTCYLYVKDRVRPVPVADKGVTVSLSDKKVWVDAASFDEGSWDNCGVNLLLARRSDWYEACIDLCDSVEYCWISEHHDTIWQAFLEPDKRKDPIEAHYAKVLQWLWEDEEPCSELLYNAWIYDLLKYGTIECTPGHYVDEHYFDELIKKVLLDQIETEKGSIVDKFKCENGLDGLSPGDILFLGTDQNDGTSLNDAFALNVDDLSTAALFSGFSVRGMAADETNNRLLISGSDANGSSNGADGSLLYSWSIDGKKDPIFLGYITVQGNRANAEGLAMINGKLYAYIDNIQNIADVDGIYEIDLQKLSATLVVPEGDFDDLDGLDGDGETGLLYGSSDGEDEIAVIDLSAGTINTLAPYPSGVTDVDGLAVGGGIIYLIQDDSAGTIHLYDIALGTYTGTIEAPFDVDDNRAGGATLFGRGICGYSKSQLAAKIDEWRAIGGGWAEEVPFSCEDACGPVIVELLVMDYWCNWGTVWTTVWVEDKTPVQVVKDVVEEETISCKTYKENRYSYPGELHPVSLEYIVEVGKTGDSTALAQLDAILGGYCKAWVDPYGNYVDEDGVEIECDIPFEDSQCYC
ncbi:MAG: hypothetical protein OEQ53_17425, partial [Saprospiraceae bacterium]|nr:hypothetical protein [Saprospiraceae bacterium]